MVSETSFPRFIDPREHTPLIEEIKEDAPS